MNQLTTLGTAASPHCFQTSRSAYSATQCYEEIKKADILHVEAEQAIIFAWTWPLLVSGHADSEENQAHTVNNDLPAILDVIQDAGLTKERVREAHDLAASLGYPIQPWVLTLLASEV